MCFEMCFVYNYFLIDGIVEIRIMMMLKNAVFITQSDSRWIHKFFLIFVNLIVVIEIYEN